MCIARGYPPRWVNVAPSVAYNTIGRDAEYVWRIGNGLRHMNNFQKANMTIHRLFYRTMKK
jgi:hypothetical protein